MSLLVARAQNSSPLRDRDALVRQSGSLIRTLASLHLAYATECEIRAEWLEVLGHRVAPPQGVNDERDHSQRQVWRRVVTEGEETGHEDLEEDEGPDESTERDEPGFAVGLVGLEVY